MNKTNVSIGLVVFTIGNFVEMVLSMVQHYA